MSTTALLLCTLLAPASTQAAAKAPSAATSPSQAPKSKAASSKAAAATKAAVIPVLTERQANMANTIGHLLRCPVCQGMSIAESPSGTAQSMMNDVRKMIAAGKTRKQIMSYFVARYGEFVLLDPTTHGINIFVWVLPPVAVLIGILLVWWWARRAGAGRSKGDGEVQELDPDTATDDDYVRLIRQEVEQ